MNIFDLIPLDILKYIISYLDNKSLLLIYAISSKFAEFSRLNLRTLLCKNLKIMTRFNLTDWSTKRLVNLIKFPLKYNNISAGERHSLVLTFDRQVYVFGDNKFGQLGLNDNENRNTPVLNYITSNDIISISAGGRHSLILTNIGQIYAFGDNKCGQLGLGDNNSKNVPIVIHEFDNIIKNSVIENNIVQISAGSDHSMVLMESGQVYMFGNNNYTVDMNIPTLINIKSCAISICAGVFHSMILMDTNQIYTFGSNGHGQLGLTPSESVKDYSGRNTLLSIGNNITDISAGICHSMILTENGNVYTFGHNGYGQLGSDDHDDRCIPTLIRKCNHVTAISAGELRSMILVDNGDVYTFGANKYGQLGLGDDRARNTPSLVQLGDSIDQIVARNHSMILTKTGKLFTFGDNKYGQLGLKDGNHRNIPEFVMSI